MLWFNDDCFEWGERTSGSSSSTSIPLCCFWEGGERCASVEGVLGDEEEEEEAEEELRAVECSRGGRVWWCA